MLLIYILLKLNNFVITTLGVIYRNFIFTVHKAKTLIPARINYLRWAEEFIKFEDKGYVTKKHKDFVFGKYEQFWERAYHEFWPYFCRTFYDYFAPKPIHISSVWRVSRDDYHNSRSSFYKTVLIWMGFINLNTVLGVKLYGTKSKRRYRKILYRHIYLPKLLLAGILNIYYIFNKEIRIKLNNASLILKTKNRLSVSYFMVSWLIFFLFAVWSFYCTNPAPAIWLITNMAVIMPVLLLWQTFMFFYKTYQLSKYTSQNQRFWKRALTVFWIIECFLFAIVMFLWFISPDNLKYGINHREVIVALNFKPSVFIQTMYSVTLILIITRFLVYTKITNNRLLYYVTAYLLTILLFSVLLNEFYQLVLMLNRASTICCDYEIIDRTYKSAETRKVFNELTESIVYNQMKSLILFLKFWHVLFIIVYIAFNQLQYFNKKSLSFDSFSSIYLNCTYLFLFNLLGIIFFSKYNFYFLVEYPTYYYHTTNKFGFIYIIIQHSLYMLYSMINHIYELVTSLFN